MFEEEKKKVEEEAMIVKYYSKKSEITDQSLVLYNKFICKVVSVREHRPEDVEIYNLDITSKRYDWNWKTVSATELINIADLLTDNKVEDACKYMCTAPDILYRNYKSQARSVPRPLLKYMYDLKKPICKICGKPITIERFAQGSSFCGICLRTKSKDGVKGYHDGGGNFKELSLKDEEKQFYGVEIEVSSYGGDGEYSYSNEELNSLASKCRDILGEICYDIEHDGSVSCGFEIITQPMTREYYFSTKVQNIFKRLFFFLNKTGLTTKRGCGTHIHTTRQPLYDANDLASGSLNVILETFKNEFKAISLREEHCYSSDSDDDDDYYCDDDDDCFSYCDFLSNQGYDDEITSEYLEDASCRADRYSAVNTDPTKTVELRLFGGVSDLVTLNAFMSIWSNMVESVKNKDFIGKDIHHFVQGYGVSEFLINNKIKLKTKKVITDTIPDYTRYNELVTMFVTALDEVDCSDNYIERYVDYIRDKFRYSRMRTPKSFRGSGIYSCLTTMKDRLISTSKDMTTLDILLNIYDEIRQLDASGATFNGGTSRSETSYYEPRLSSMPSSNDITQNMWAELHERCTVRYGGSLGEETQEETQEEEI